MRKIIHFESKPSGAFLALANDGTMWNVFWDTEEKTSNNAFGGWVWSEITGLPQPEKEEKENTDTRVPCKGCGETEVVCLCESCKVMADNSNFM